MTCFNGQMTRLVLRLGCRLETRIGRLEQSSILIPTHCLDSHMRAFDTNSQLDDIAVRDTRVSDAIDEPMRAMILDILADNELTASEVHDQLDDRGIDRTENTIRHHINELRDAGLVDVVRFEEGRGGTTKYYGANTIVLSYSLPNSVDPAIEEMAGAVQPQIQAALDTLTEEYDELIDEITAEMQPCDHCRTQKYETYVLLTVLRRAFVQAHKAE